MLLSVQSEKFALLLSRNHLYSEEHTFMPYLGKAGVPTPPSQWHTLSATAYLRRLVAAQRALRHARAAALLDEHRAAGLRT